jgi:hypothetical protein
LAKLCRKLRQVAVVESAQIFRVAHPVKQQRWVFGAHLLPAENKEMACNRPLVTRPLSTRTLSFN